jgi:NAD(P)-dependent dehydrogenase (short-subunit alcohol dehydrogenase family)
MPRPISEQVIVITGASSGIGRETAIEAGRRGASVVLAARSEDALRLAAQEITSAGGKAHVVVCDVAEADQVQRLADEAEYRFGRIDTWVNNASVSVYSPIDALTIDEIDRVLQVNLNGTIYGCQAALRKMSRKHGGEGGTIINVSSGLGERSIPLQSIYCTAKHGVNGFTEALRVEMERDNTGINVTCVMPAAINTPFYEHARSKLGVKPQPVRPVYPVEVVSETILFACEHPRRDLYAGGAGKMFGVGEALSPKMLDGMMQAGDALWKMQKSDQADDGRDNLFAPMNGPAQSTAVSAISPKNAACTRRFWSGTPTASVSCSPPPLPEPSPCSSAAATTTPARPTTRSRCARANPRRHVTSNAKPARRSCPPGRFLFHRRVMEQKRPIPRRPQSRPRNHRQSRRRNRTEIRAEIVADELVGAAAAGVTHGHAAIGEVVAGALVQAKSTAAILACAAESLVRTAPPRGAQLHHATEHTWPLSLRRGRRAVRRHRRDRNRTIGKRDASGTGSARGPSS